MVISVTGQKLYVTIPHEMVFMENVNNNITKYERD